MKPYIHAKNSVKRYGGIIEDYIAIHNWFDSRVNIEFPWTQPDEREYVFVPTEEFPNEVIE